MRALILVGPPGAGKTTVVTALSSLLAEDDVRHAVVEVESLALVHPWPDDDAAFAHLEMLSGSFGLRGYGLLLVGATVDGPGYLARLLAAVRADDVVVARLQAPPAVLRERIARREPPEWAGLQRLLDAAGPLADAHGHLPGVDLVLDTSDADPRAVARALRELIARPDR